MSLLGYSSNLLKIDRWLKPLYRNPRNYQEYTVAIFNNKVRTKWDNIEIKTKPYLDRLVGSGILTSKIQEVIEGEKKDKGQFFNATIYQLSDQYKHIMDKRDGCINLGEGKIELVSLNIRKVSFPGLSSSETEGEGGVRFKCIRKFPNAPDWTKDASFQAW